MGPGKAVRIVNHLKEPRNAVSSWRNISVDSFEAAKQLKDSGRVRSALSRAYYSAYALVTGELQRAGHTISAGDRPNPAHEQLVAMAKHNLDVDPGVRVRAAGVPRMLRQMRSAADYDPQASVTNADAVFALPRIQPAPPVAQELTMVADNPQRIAKLVQERLRTAGSVGARLRVVAEDVVRQTSDGEWWYVPVSIERDPARMGEIYYTLSNVEDLIEEEDHLSVLLVPASSPLKTPRPPAEQTRRTEIDPSHAARAARG